MSMDFLAVLQANLQKLPFSLDLQNITINPGSSGYSVWILDKEFLLQDINIYCILNRYVPNNLYIVQFIVVVHWTLVCCGGLSPDPEFPWFGQLEEVSSRVTSCCSVVETSEMRKICIYAGNQSWKVSLAGLNLFAPSTFVLWNVWVSFTPNFQV